MPDSIRRLWRTVVSRRVTVMWVIAAILLLIGLWPIGAFIAQPGISWENETVDDFASGHVRNPEAVVASAGFLPNERGLYLRPGTQGRFVYRTQKPAGQPLLLQAWIYGHAPGVSSSLSVVGDSGSPAVVFLDVQVVGELIHLPAAVDEASQVDLVLQVTNGGLSNALIVDQIIWGTGRGAVPTPAPLWPIGFIAASAAFAAFASLRGRGSTAIALTVAALTALTLFSRLDALERHYLDPLDPDAVNYRVYADRFQWWPPWQSGVFSAEFSEREPLYPLVVHAYFDVLGSSDFHLRVVSSSFSVLAVGLTLVAARRRLRWPLALAVTAAVAANEPLIAESYRGLRTELEFCTVLALYLALDRGEPARNPVTPLVVGAVGGLLVLTRTFYMPMALIVIALSALARYRRARSAAASVLIASAVLLVPVVGHRAGLQLQEADPFYDTAVYARWLANVELFVQMRPLPHPELFPAAADYGRYGPYFGPPITYAQYLFQLHSLPEFITASAHGYVDIFRTTVLVGPPPNFQAVPLAQLISFADVFLKCSAVVGLAMLTIAALRRRRPLDLLLPAFVVGVLSFSAFLYHLGLIEQYRNTIQILPFVLISAGTAIEAAFRRLDPTRLAARIQQWVPKLRSDVSGIPRTERLAVGTGLIAGLVGAVGVNFISMSITGPLGIVATIVAALFAVGAAIRGPVWAAWLLVFAVLFPIHLVPYTLTTVVVVATYAVVGGRIAMRRDRPRVGIGVPATGVLALTIVTAATGATLAGNSVASDGGLRIAAAFVLLMGIAFSVPQLVRQDGRTTVFFTVALAVGMSAWGVVEYAGRTGLIPISPQAWLNDPLTKAFPGALSSAFVGGGPNTYAVFLAVTLVLAMVGLRERALAPLATPAAILISLNLAFTYSRGGAVAALAGLLWLLIRARPGTRRPVRAVLLILIAGLVLAYGVAFARTGLPIVPGANSETWRSFVADPSWAVEQTLDVPGQQSPDKLFIKLRAAPGDGYQVEVTVNGRVVFSGRSALPSADREWVEIPLPPDLLGNTKLANVECRLVGSGDQHDRYFEVEGSTNPLPGAMSRFRRGATVQDLDLSPDPGTQSGSYLITFVAPDPSAQAKDNPPSFTTIGASVVNAAANVIRENDRLPLWRAALRSFATHPVFGIGFYSSSAVLRDEATTIDYANFHNEFLEFLADSGLLGFLGLLAFFALLGQDLRRQSRAPTGGNSLAVSLEAALIALGFAFLFGSFLVDSRIAGLTWLIAGLVGTYDARILRWPRWSSVAPRSRRET